MRIILAVDGSTCSDFAVETMMHQHNPTETEVLVVHAVDTQNLLPIHYSYGMGPAFVHDYTNVVQQLRKQGEDLAARTAASLQAAGFKTYTQVEECDARDLILECATKWNADLIVLGSHGRRGLNRFVMGSVSEAVARHASCSVEIVRTGTRAA